MARPKVDKKNLRTERFVFKLSENQIKTMGGLTNAKLQLKTLNSLFISAVNRKDDTYLQGFIKNMLKNI